MTSKSISIKKNKNKKHIDKPVKYFNPLKNKIKINKLWNLILNHSILIDKIDKNNFEKKTKN